MHSNQSTQQNNPTAFLIPNAVLSRLVIGFISYLALMTMSHAQTVTVTGNIPYAADLKNEDGSLNVWTMSKIREDKHETINPIEGNDASVMERDSNSISSKLGDRSYIPNETKPVYEGTLDLTNAVLPATIAILVDDIATLTIKEIPNGNEPAGHTPFTKSYEVKGTALWNPKSYQEFPTPLPPGHKYQLALVYKNNANLTANYTDGKVDVDGVSVYVSLFPVEVAPDFLAVNSDFDEGRIDPATGYAIPDCDDASIALEAVLDHLDGKFKVNERVTDDLHQGFFGVNPSQFDDAFWDGANVTIRKVNKTDSATGHPESGQIRLYGKWGEGASEYRAIIPYDLETLVATNLSAGGINKVAGESVYGSASAFPARTSFFIEGIHPGKITLEWR